MKRRIRRTFVISGVVACLLAGAVSIRVAAEMTAAAAPPPAPPISMDALRTALTAEQARAASLQAQLDDLMSVTDQLTTALSSTEGEVKVDGLTAKQLRQRLKAADAKLKNVNVLLRLAQRRLTALGAPIPTLPPAKPTKPPSGGGSSATPTPPPATPAPAGFSLSLDIVSGNVRVDWTTCSASGFTGYAVVRARDNQIHYPPETGNTLVAQIGSRSTTSFTDAAPSGTQYYRVYCLVNIDNETKVAAQTAAVRINVP